jgi:hypothetical protein
MDIESTGKILDKLDDYFLRHPNRSTEESVEV